MSVINQMLKDLDERQNEQNSHQSSTSTVVVNSSPKKLIVQKNGDHRMSDENNQTEFIREASLWFKAGLTSS